MLNFNAQYNTIILQKSVENIILKLQNFSGSKLRVCVQYPPEDRQLQSSRGLQRSGGQTQTLSRGDILHMYLILYLISNIITICLLSTCVAGATPSPRARSPAPSTPSPTSTPWPASMTSGASRERRGECSDDFSHPCLQGAERIQDITQL